MTDAQTLVTNAKCYLCIPEGMQLSVLIYLADIIASGGGTGGGVQVFLIANGDSPLEVPDNGAGVAYTVAGDFWTYDDATNNWNKIISA